MIFIMGGIAADLALQAELSFPPKMHPLVRDLYKRVLLAGRDYPTGIDHVKAAWKKALRNPRNRPSCYGASGGGNDEAKGREPARTSTACEREIRRAVAKGRHMVNEMAGVARLKKYRAMKERYEKSTAP
jgi:hypothetical protein